MSDFDFFETLLKFAIPAIWVAIKVFQNTNKAKQTPVASPVPAPQPTPRARPQLPRSTSAASKAAGMVARLYDSHARLTESKGRVEEKVLARGARGEVLKRVLDTTVTEELAELAGLLEKARTGGFLDGSVSVEMLDFRSRRLSDQLRVVELATSLGAHPELDAVMADAESIADASIAPFQQFADFHDIPFVHQQAVCLPAALVGGEAAWIGLLGLGVPVVFVPTDFSTDLYRWPSIAHELGHVILRAVPGLHDEMRRVTGWTARPDVLRVERGRIAGSPLQAWSAWSEELFADAFTVLMLGPAALYGFEAVFANPDDPATVLQARAANGRYAPHPPAHLRLHLSAFLLEEMGFIEEGRSAARSWNRLHGFPDVLDAEDPDMPSLLLPLSDGRMVGMNLDAAFQRGTHALREWLTSQYVSLAGHGVMAIPGFDLPPGHWARVKRLANQLQVGATPHADGRSLLAAAILAGSKTGAQVQTIARAVQAAIIGRGESSRRSSARHTPAGPDSTASLLVDALLLQEILERPRRGAHPRRGIR